MLLLYFYDGWDKMNGLGEIVMASCENNYIKFGRHGSMMRYKERWREERKRMGNGKLNVLEVKGMIIMSTFESQF